MEKLEIPTKKQVEELGKKTCSMCFCSQFPAVIAISSSVLSIDY